MLRTIYQSSEPAFEWLDLVEPTRQDLEAIARSHGLMATAVTDCLDPEHLPKFERYDGTSFAILRAHDERAGATADTVHAFTRKVAMFWGTGFLITIHRQDQPYLTALMEQWRQRPAGSEDATARCTELLVDITNAVVASFEPPLEAAEAWVDAVEAEITTERDVASVVREVYVVKRRVTLTKRLLWRTLHVAARLSAPGDRHAALLQDLRENAESMHFYADELLDDVNNLLSMQFALATHRTNEVMRVLTIFSAFFLPLTFIVGIYGMNFRFMPELEQPLGYPGVWLVMIGVSLAIAFWFRRQRWA